MGSAWGWMEVYQGPLKSGSSSSNILLRMGGAPIISSWGWIPSGMDGAPIDPVRGWMEISCNQYEPG
eukprot:8546151-Pyramimonas_sp.AAC.1